ncbi:nucleoside hydrolase [Ktedonobacter sp. SOSP1-52]|nr:nucleoside hydrolase [Ktedonobacter sp. SOSP1-52]
MVRILLDTDPGIDDALALFLALASQEIKLEAITTVSGNVSVEQTTRNALALLELLKRTDIPVARGCADPLVGQRRVDANGVYGDDGLGNIFLPEPRQRPVQHDAVTMIIEKVMAAPGEVTLVALGPLTNIALAVRQEPKLAQAVREVVIMGGALRVPGNVNPAAELNIFADAHAAQIVLHAHWPLRLVPLDVTERALLKRRQAHELMKNGSAITACIKRMVDFYCDGQTNQQEVFHMHDPLCLASVVRPNLLTWQRAFVEIELTGKLTFGETVASFENPSRPLPAPFNVLAAVDVDVDGFLQFYLERIHAAFSI